MIALVPSYMLVIGCHFCSEADIILYCSRWKDKLYIHSNLQFYNFFRAFLGSFDVAATPRISDKRIYVSRPYNETDFDGLKLFPDAVSKWNTFAYYR